MPDNCRLAVAVLAAGQSRRFGAQDKLAAEFRGMMLGLHAVRTIPRSSFAYAWVIAGEPSHPCSKAWRDAGYEIQLNPRREEGMGSSVALAAQLARSARADALLIALADMPLVPAGHYRALIDAARTSAPARPLSSNDGKRRMPPAIFGSGQFEALQRLSGDAGARVLLAEGRSIACPPEWLVDIDTPEALAARQ